jgi:NAD(P) transhydrogenase subunit beta
MTIDSIAVAAYLVAALLFIMSLAGLSKHETAKQGIWWRPSRSPCPVARAARA